MSESKKYYWIKLKTDYFNSDAIDWLLSQKNGCEYVVLYLMLCLKTANASGTLATQIGEMLIPYDVEKIVRDTKYFDTDTVIVALELYKKLGMIYEDNNGSLVISNYTDMVGSETSSAKAMREWRKKKQLQIPSQCESQCDNNVTQEIENRDKSIENRDKSIEKEKDKEKRETFVSVLNAYTSNPELLSSLTDFVDMRKKMKGFTTRALRLALNKLDTMSSTDAGKAEIVNQSVMNGWKSFYPVKNSNNYKHDIVQMPSYWQDEQNHINIEEDPAESIRSKYNAEKIMLDMDMITAEEFEERTANYKAMYKDLTGKELS